MEIPEGATHRWLKTRTTEHLRITDILYAPGFIQPRHTHPFASFSFVSSGSYRETFGRKIHARQSATAIFHPPEESHAVRYDSKVRIVSVHFSFEKLASIRAHANILDTPSSCRTETMSWLGARLARELRREDTAALLAIEGLALEMLAEASRDNTGNGKDFPHWLKDAKDFLHDNFANSFALEDVAKIAGVHPAHLSRVFRAKFDCTVGEYVRRLRVEFACRQILTTELTLSEIAAHAGFSDQSHFNKVFKSFVNLTPYQYRKLSSMSGSHKNARFVQDLIG